MGDWWTSFDGGEKPGAEGDLSRTYPRSWRAAKNLVQGAFRAYNLPEIRAKKEFSLAIHTLREREACSHNQEIYEKSRGELSRP